jgi:hypothetical protein
MISFTPGGEPAPWDGLLIQEGDHRILSLDLLCESRPLAQLRDDGTLLVADEDGELQPSTDMTALGRAFYRAMIGKEPP